MSGRSRQQRVTKRVYALATLVRNGHYNDAQLRYLQAVLDHYHHAIKEMTTDDHA
ncbi:hypothetical protein AAFP35_10060 [Gordonia sp. CPCC 206044]|uniref:hypothetical protein n=1 Tax=Gordonia sp. CPCC 206044 TaxID=3140793 RepID=UPI003AF3652B